MKAILKTVGGVDISRIFLLPPVCVCSDVTPVTPG